MSWTRYWSLKGLSLCALPIEGVEAYLSELRAELAALSWCQPRGRALRGAQTQAQRRALARLSCELHSRQMPPVVQWHLSDAARRPLSRQGAADLIALLVVRRPMPGIATPAPGVTP